MESSHLSFLSFSLWHYKESKTENLHTRIVQFFAVCACMLNFASLCYHVCVPEKWYIHLDVGELVHACATQACTRNIISRNIISHIAVMTLGRYVDYTVGKQQPADWVSILPYITSLHSSLCFFLLPSFFQITSHFPPSFLGEVPGYASRWCGVIWWWEGTTMQEKKTQSAAVVVTRLDVGQSPVIG